MIDLNDYIAAGYFVTKYATDGWWKSPIMPERVISISECIGKPLLAYWGWDTDRYRESIQKFGIPEDKLEEFHKWSLRADVDNRYIAKLSDARWLIQNIFPRNSDALLIGVGIHRELVDNFLTFKPYPDEHPNYTVYQDSKAELTARLAVENHVVKERVPLENGGQVLGFEVVSFYFNLAHSWLCSGLEKPMSDLFGIHPNQNGLISTYEEAKKVYDWIVEDKMQGTRRT